MRRSGAATRNLFDDCTSYAPRTTGAPGDLEAWLTQACITVEQFAARRHPLDPPFVLDEAIGWAQRSMEAPPEGESWEAVPAALRRRRRITQRKCGGWKWKKYGAD